MSAKIDSDDVRKELGGLLGRALEALEEVKEVVVRSSQAGKLRIDTAFLEREREKAILRLGEKVYEWFEDGEISLPEEGEPLIAEVRRLAELIEEHRKELRAVREED